MVIKKNVFLTSFLLIICICIANAVEPTNDSDRNVNYTKLLLHGFGPDGFSIIVENSASNHHIKTFGDVQIDTAQSKIGSGSILFDGKGDYLSIPDSNDWNLAEGDFTIDFWVMFNSVSEDQTLLCHNDNVSTTGQSWYMHYGGISKRLRFHWYHSNSTGNYNMEFPWTPATGIWYHVAIVRRGNSFMSFVNGSQIGDTQTASETIQDSNDLLYIGVFNNAGSLIYHLNGWIDELRISKGIARWTSKFSTPVSEYYSDT